MDDGHTVIYALTFTVILGALLGRVAGLVVARRRHRTAAVQLFDPESDLEKQDQQWREIYYNGLEPVWNESFGWMTTGPSFIEVAAEAIRPVRPLTHCTDSDLAGLLGASVAEFDRLDRLARGQRFTEADVWQAEALRNEIDQLKAEKNRRAPARCRTGLHDDGTDAFGGYSPTCLRCGKEI